MHPRIHTVSSAGAGISRLRAAGARPRGRLPAELSAAHVDELGTKNPVTRDPLLTVRGVRKRFGGLHALDGVSLDVGDGSITGLIGPNGAGKTTLFEVVSGLLAPDSGEIRLASVRLDGVPAHEIARRGLARTFQIPRPLARLTVLENLLLYAKDQPGERLRGLVTRRAAIAHRSLCSSRGRARSSR